MLAVTTLQPFGAPGVLVFGETAASEALWVIVQHLSFFTISHRLMVRTRHLFQKVFEISLELQITPVDINDITLTLTCICPGPALDTYESVQRCTKGIGSNNQLMPGSRYTLKILRIELDWRLWSAFKVLWSTLWHCTWPRSVGTHFWSPVLQKLSLNMTIIGWWHWHYNQNHSQSIPAIPVLYLWVVHPAESLETRKCWCRWCNLAPPSASRLASSRPQVIGTFNQFESHTDILTTRAYCILKTSVSQAAGLDKAERLALISGLARIWRCSFSYLVTEHIDTYWTYWTS